MKSSDLGIVGVGIQLTYVGKDAGIGGRIGSGRPTDGGLINIDNLIQLFYPFDSIMFAAPALSPVKLGRQRLIKDLIDQRAFTRAGNAR